MNYFQQIIQESRAVTGHAPDHAGNTGSMPGFTVGDTIQSLSNKSPLATPPLATHGYNTNFMESQSPDVEHNVSWSGERQGGEGPGFVPVDESLEITVEEAGQTVSDNLRFSPIQAGVEAKDDMSKADRQEDTHRFEILESHRAGRIESQGKPESEEMSGSKGPGWQQPAVPVSLFDDSETGTENGADPNPLSFYDSHHGGLYSTTNQVVSTTGSGQDPEKDLKHPDSADNPLENRQATPDNVGRYSVIADAQFPQDQGPPAPEATPLDPGRAIKGQGAGSPSDPSPSESVQVDHTFQTLPSARDDGFPKNIPEPGASKAGTIPDRAQDTGEPRGQETRSGSRDDSSLADQVVSTTGSGRDLEKDLKHPDSADNPSENRQATPDNVGRYSVIADTQSPQDQGPPAPEANPLDPGRAIKGQGAGSPYEPSPSESVQVDHTFQALPSARDDGFPKNIPETGASKAGTIPDRAPDTGETRGQETRSGSRDGSSQSDKKQSIEPPIPLNIPRQSAPTPLDSRLSNGLKTTAVKESMDPGRSKGSKAAAKALPFSVDTGTDPARKTVPGPLTAQTISGTVKHHPADDPALHVAQMFDRRDGWGTSQTPDRPAVHIGHIDVIVEAPKAPAVNPVQTVPAPDPSSRMYLRRL